MARLMNALLPMSKPKISEASSSAISSQASEAGPTLFDSLDGQMTDPSGPEVVPVSRSRQPAPKLGEPIRATFGRRGFGSSESAALMSSLVNKLKQRLPMDGSILFVMTWSEKATPSGRVVSRLRVSARRTSDLGSGSWPSPNAGPQNDNDSTWEQRRRMAKAKHGNNGFGLTLGMATQLAAWPTPQATDEQRGLRSDNGRRGAMLSEILHGWAAPAARDFKDFQDGRSLNPAEALGPKPSGFHVGTANHGQLNPAFSLWLMGFPTAWAYCAARVTRLSRKLRRNSSEPIST